jgi:multiple sugar transport system permease protein
MEQGGVSLINKRNYKNSLLKIALLLLAFLVLLPLWFIGEGSLLPIDELKAYLSPVLRGGKGYAFWPILPRYPTLQPLIELLFDTPQFFVMFWNTVKLAGYVVLGQFLVGAPAAWAFSRFRFPGRKVLFTFYIVLMLMPFQVTMVSSYLVADRLGILNTLWSVILPGVFSTFPVFIMSKGFDVVPDALLEAAALDGAGPVSIFFRIGIPLGMPGIISALVLSFLECWNMIEQPMVFLKDKKLWPLALYLPQISQDNLGLAMVSSLLMLLPAVLISLFGQKYLELGIQSTGIKE